jgi:hypothetical protein
MCFGGKSQPAPAPIPQPPSTDAAENQRRVAEEKQRALNAGGRGTTILTSGLGADNFDSAGKKSTNLLGETGPVG